MKGHALCFDLPRYGAARHPEVIARAVCLGTRRAINQYRVKQNAPAARSRRGVLCKASLVRLPPQKRGNVEFFLMVDLWKFLLQRLGCLAALSLRGRARQDLGG